MSAMRNRSRSMALGAAVVAVISVPLLVSMTAEASTDVLLSRGRPVAVSSVEGSAYAARNAVDGVTRSRWASAEGAGSQWLRVDLGSAHTVTRVRLMWEAAYAKAYQVQVSPDGATWTTIYSTSVADGGADDLRVRGTGRYVRVLGTRRGTGYGYSLWEVQVYGSGLTAPTIGSSGVATTTPSGRTAPGSPAGLDSPRKKDLAMQLVSSAENSSLNWRDQYGYLEDIRDGRGYTGGIIGFCSGTSDMLALVEEYTRRSPRNVLAKYLPALRTVDGSDSHAGLDPNFPRDWKTAAADPVFQKTQEDERDRAYFVPAVTMAKSDGVRALGQFAYYDAAVMHGVSGMRGIRAAALRVAKTPAQGGDEVAWLNAFLDAREAEMRTEEAHSDTTRVSTAQRAFLRASNLDLDLPLTWGVYGDRFTVTS